MAPDDVRSVITLGSPLRHHQSTAVSNLYKMVSEQDESDADDEILERMSGPPPVPSTAIYSRSDGVVPWRCSLEKESPFTENIRVFSSHLGLGHNPSVLWAKHKWLLNRRILCLHDDLSPIAFGATWRWAPGFGLTRISGQWYLHFATP